MHSGQPSIDELEAVKRAFFADRKDLVGNERRWRLLLTEEEVQLAVRKLAQDINVRFNGQELVVVCTLKGCVYFFVDLTRQLTIPHSTYFLEASSYGEGMEQSAKVELLSLIVPEKFKGKKVLLLDELFDNGVTLHSVKCALVANEAAGLREEDVTTCTVFQKKKAVVPVNTDGKPYAPPDLVALPYVPDLWLVGYGLDDTQHKRGWPHVFAVPKGDTIERVAEDGIFEEDAFGNMTMDARRLYLNIRSDLLWVLHSV